MGFGRVIVRRRYRDPDVRQQVGDRVLERGREDVRRGRTGRDQDRPDHDERREPSSPDAATAARVALGRPLEHGDGRAHGVRLARELLVGGRRRQGAERSHDVLVAGGDVLGTDARGEQEIGHALLEVGVERVVREAARPAHDAAPAADVSQLSVRSACVCSPRIESAG